MPAMSRNESLKLLEITVIEVFLQDLDQVLPENVGSTLRMQLAPTQYLWMGETLAPARLHSYPFPLSP